MSTEPYPSPRHGEYATDTNLIGYTTVAVVKSELQSIVVRWAAKSYDRNTLYAVIRPPGSVYDSRTEDGKRTAVLCTRYYVAVRHHNNC
jgi:hypothetical protein